MLTTILIAIFLMIFAGGALAIGFFITGKGRLRRGCGRLPDDQKGSSCTLCGDKKKCEDLKK